MFHNLRPIYPFRVYFYRVQRGDTLYKIAERFNTTVELILRFNYIPNPNMLSVGMVIVIPVSHPDAIVYTVQRGDTLYSIAERYNTTIRSIMRLNYLTNPNVIYEGQRLIIIPG